MRKKLFFGLIVTLIVVLLLFAFANIGSTAPIYITSIYPKSMNMTFVILLSGLIGFLIGFAAMLHSHELRREKDTQNEVEAVGAAPAAVTAAEVAKEVPEQAVESAEVEESAEKNDDFDEDDEILG
ncbi:MAG: hypothetical protein P1V18_01330 [Candidatus Gracilibacteria bacterium]|nr:hypothetical protein [Candidatus Gracilibacteria bacterium]